MLHRTLLCTSESAILSDWVEDEVEAAQEKERIALEQQDKKHTALFPVRLDESVKTTTQAWVVLQNLWEDAKDVKAHLPVQLRLPLQTGGR